MTNDCSMCGRPIVDTAYVDIACAGRVSRRLAEAGDLYHEIAVTIARQDRFGDRVRTGSTEPPLPFRPEASADSRAVENAITTWARHIEGHRGNAIPAHPAQMFAWLAQQCDWLRYRPEAAEALDELEDAASLVIRIVDAPAPRSYLGPCREDGCRGELYAIPGRVVRCRDCGAVHDAEGRKRWLLGEAVNVRAHAAEIARYASALRGETVTSAMIRGLAHRTRIVAVGTDDRGRPTYRVGDVLEVMGSERMAA